MIVIILALAAAITVTTATKATPTWVTTANTMLAGCQLSPVDSVKKSKVGVAEEAFLDYCKGYCEDKVEGCKAISERTRQNAQECFFFTSICTEGPRSNTHWSFHFQASGSSTSGSSTSGSSTSGSSTSGSSTSGFSTSGAATKPASTTTTTTITTATEATLAWFTVAQVMGCEEDKITSPVDQLKKHSVGSLSDKQFLDVCKDYCRDKLEGCKAIAEHTGTVHGSYKDQNKAQNGAQ